MNTDPRTEFVEEAAALAAELLGATVEDHRDEFSLRITPPDKDAVVLYLGNLYTETRLLSDEERGFRIRAALWAALPEPRPVTWEEASPRLLPAVRPAVSRFSAEPVVRRPLAPLVDLTVTLDMGHSISGVVEDDLAAWQVDASDAFDVATSNLAETGLQLEEMEAGFVITSPDSYGSAWLGLPELLAGVSSSTDGPMVALAPSRDALRLVPLEDEDAIVAAIERALADFEDEPRRVSPVPYVVLGDEVRPWVPPIGHPAHELVRVAERVLANVAYNEQQDLLREALARAGDQTRIASHMLVTHRDDGHMWSWTLWSAEEAQSLIPRADFVLLFEPGHPERPVAVSWDDFLAHAGTQVREEVGYRAPLWRASRSPTEVLASALARLAVEFPPRFEEVAGHKS